jgi:MFS family permease
METALGVARAQLSGALLLALLVSGVAAVPVGRWVDRHGARGLMTAGSLVAAGLVWAWAQARTLPALYLIFGGLGLAMAAGTTRPLRCWRRGSNGAASTPC